MPKQLNHYISHSSSLSPSMKYDSGKKTENSRESNSNKRLKDRKGSNLNRRPLMPNTGLYDKKKIPKKDSFN